MIPGRKPLWKTFNITSVQAVRQLESCWGSSKRAWGKRNYVFDTTTNVGDIETNLPFVALRDLFRFAGVPWQDCVTDTVTCEERFGGVT